MKTPWTKAIDKLELKVQRTLDKLSKIIIEQDGLTHEKAMSQLNIVKRSEQIKYNRLNSSILELQECLKDQLKEYRMALIDRDRIAASEIDKNAND